MRFNLKTSLLALLAVTFFTFIACENAESNTDNVEENIENALEEVEEAGDKIAKNTSDWSAEKKQEFEESVNKTVSDVDQKMVELREKMDNAAGEAKAKYKDAIDELNEYRQELEAWRGKASNEIETKWDEFRNNLSDLLEKMSEEVKE